MSLDESHCQLSTGRAGSSRPHRGQGGAGERGPGFSPSALLSTGGKPTAATAHLQAASPLQPRLKPFAHKATWKLMFLLVSLF